MSLQLLNSIRWKNMVVHTNALAALDRTAKRLIAAKERYQHVEAETGVPWPLIAVVHEREASQSWMANLAQGDRWDRKSTHIPRGQGPFKSWDSAAVNALMHSAPFMGRNKNWSIGSALTELEKYNGLGYSRMGRPSPYVWSKSNQYIRGKYVADGVYNANAVDVQEGCAPLLRRMMVMDKTINEKYKWDEGKAAAVTIVTSAAVVTGGSVAVAQSPELWPWILGGSIATLILSSIVYYIYKRNYK
jgi:lysozyme family protein